MSYVLIFFVMASFLGRFGGSIYRLIIASTLVPEDYELFVLLINTITLLLPLVGFGLHIPLTREIKIANLQSNFLSGYIWIYRIGGFFGIIALYVLNIILEINLGFGLFLFVAGALIGWGYHEYYIGILRGEGKTKRVSMLIAIPGLLRLLIILAIYVIGSINLTVVIVIYSIPFYGIAILNSFQHPKYMKLWLVASFKELSKVRGTFVQGFSAFFTIFANNSTIWIVTLIASLTLQAQDFVVFDLLILFISIIGVVTANITISILQVHSRPSDIVSLGTFVKLQIVSSIGLLTTIILSFFLVIFRNAFSQLISLIIDIQNVELFELFVLYSLFIPIAMVTASMTKGLYQAIGKLHIQAFIDLIGLLTILSMAYYIYQQQQVQFLPLIVVVYNIVHYLAFIIWWVISRWMYKS